VKLAPRVKGARADRVLGFSRLVCYNVHKTGHLDLFGGLNMKDVSVAEAKSRFSELISRATAGERFLIRRRSHPVAVLIGSGELDRLERMSQMAHRLALLLGQDAALLKQVEEEKVHPAMAAYGLWRDESDLDALGDEIQTNRQAQVSRPGIVM
jgi:prevent-host-death family protein